VRDLAQHFQWIHTLDRAKVAHGLNRFRHGEPINVCIQLDLEADDRRYGVQANKLDALICDVESLPNLHLRGLMLMPAPGKDEQALQRVFAEAKGIFDAAKGGVSDPDSWDTLSMGMSGDYAIALEAGSNCVRIGTAIFGPRTSTVCIDLAYRHRPVGKVNTYCLAACAVGIRGCKSAYATS